MSRPLQRRSFTSSPGRRWVRGDREFGGMPDSPMRRNYPDGSLTNPIFWLGNDQGLSTPGWAAYGAPQGLQQPYLSSDGILPAVTRATALIVNPIIQTKWSYSREPVSGEITPTDVHVSAESIPRPLWISDPQLLGRIPGGEANRPTIPRPRRLNAHQWWSTLLTHALWWGCGAFMYVADYQGQPLAGTLRILNPDRYSWTDDGRYQLFGDDDEEPLESDFDGAFHVGGVEWRMVTIRNFPPSDGYVTGGALSRSGLVLSTGNKMNSYLSSILGSGVPSGLLSVQTANFQESQAIALKEQWMAAHGGSRKSVAVLSAGIDFTPLQLSVVDSDVVAAKGSWLTDIAHAFGLSAAMLDATGGGSNLTYQNLQDARRDHLDTALIGLGRAVEDVVSSLLPWGSAMKVKWADYLGTDPNLSVPWVTAGIEQGWMTKEEARDLFNLTPVELDPQEVVPQPPQLEGGGDAPADSNG